MHGDVAEHVHNALPLALSLLAQCVCNRQRAAGRLERLPAALDADLRVTGPACSGASTGIIDVVGKAGCLPPYSDSSLVRLQLHHWLTRQILTARSS